MVLYGSKRPKKDQSFAGHGIGVGQKNVEERVRSGDGPYMDQFKLMKKNYISRI